MNSHDHANHSHKHSIACGHTKIQHGDHIDYVHDGHMHHLDGDTLHECKIDITEANPDECKPINCGCDHENNCGHELINHGDHVDFLVNGRLHHVHGGHCDDHGPVDIVKVG